MFFEIKKHVFLQNKIWFITLNNSLSIFSYLQIRETISTIQELRIVRKFWYNFLTKKFLNKTIS